jgi:lauroyl/myristoyl acyltransferase
MTMEIGERPDSRDAVCHRPSTIKVVDPENGEEFHFFKRRPTSSSPSRWFTRGDAGAVTRIAVAATAVEVLPRERWIPVVEAIPHRRKRSTRRRIEVGLHAYFGSAVDRKFLAETSARYRQGSARRLTLYAVDAIGNWQPSISLRGRRRLEQALARGEGAILWCDSFLFQALVGKRALFQSGFHGYQASLTDHGYSRTLLGRFTLNTFQQRQEAKYAHRLAFHRDDPATAVRLILKQLRQGNLVLITNNTAAASQTMEMPLGCRGRLRLATGPVRIAQTYGTPLLPFALFEIEPYRRYEALVGDEIRLPSRTDENTPLSIATAMISYRTWLEPHIQRFPEQWMRWPTLVSGDDVESEAV